MSDTDDFIARYLNGLQKMLENQGVQEPNQPRTVQQAAQQALDVQDACNLSGVVLAFGEVLTDTLWPVAREIGQGTDWVNQHPISKAFASKITHLTRLDEDPTSKFFDECATLAKPHADPKH
jgi:hypothetical protein